MQGSSGKKTKKMKRNEAKEANQKRKAKEIKTRKKEKIFIPKREMGKRKCVGRKGSAFETRRGYCQLAVAEGLHRVTSQFATNRGDTTNTLLHLILAMSATLVLWHNFLDQDVGIANRMIEASRSAAKRPLEAPTRSARLEKKHPWRRQSLRVYRWDVGQISSMVGLILRHADENDYDFADP